MAILDQETLASLANRADLADPAKYDPAYIAAVIADAADAIAGYLGFDPVLQVVTAEEGTVSYVQSGAYVGRYALTLGHAPLIPGPASAIFSSLQLRYGLSNLPDSAVSLDTVTVLHALGRAFTLAPGAVEALTWQYGLTPGVQAVGFVASYVAGYATGIDDPMLPGNIAYGAPPMPANITQAAVLLCRERIALDDAANQQTTNASAGSISYIRTADQEVKYQTYSQTSTTGSSSQLGSGTALSTAAAKRLNSYRRVLLPMFI